MPFGFPSSMVRLLRCPRDGAELALDSSTPAAPAIERGTLRCVACAATHAIVGGIASLLLDAPLNAESAFEMRARDGQFAAAVAPVDPYIAEWRHATEIEPTLRACEPFAGKIVAEFGCGAGRFTAPLAQRAAAVLAIDLSRECLVKLSHKLDSSTHVGLVWADVGSLNLAPNAFDCILSTLHSNLPTREHRLASNRTAAHALTDGGRYVFSMHFHATRDFLNGVPAAGHYDGTGIYRYHMRPAEARREIAPYFEHVRFEPVLTSVPAVRSIAMTRIAQRIPGLNSLAALLLGIAVLPRRAPQVDYVSPLSRLVTRLLKPRRAPAG